MKIENVEFHYLADDVIRNIGDGSQDALLVRVTMDDGSEGWGVATCGPDIEIREGAVVPANAMIYKSEEV